MKGDLEVIALAEAILASRYAATPQLSTTGVDDMTKRMSNEGSQKPGLGLLVKIASICQHLDEGTGKTAHEFDIIAARALLKDPEVAAWLDAMDRQGFLPVKR